MDYEKAYNSLVAKVKKAHLFAQTDSTKKVLEDILPELRESEDEKVRTLLVALVQWGKTFNQSGLDTNTANKMLSYLEKQKEHQETCTTFLAKILKHSAEGFRNVLKKKGINYIPHESFWTNTAGTFSKQECNEFYKWMDDMTMELVTEETPEYKKGFKDGLDASKKEQKPVHTAKEAWKEMRLEVYAQAFGNRHEPNYSDDSTKMFSLCDIDEIFEKIGDSTIGSQPAEWSEEDEKLLDLWLDVIDRNDWRMDENFCKASREFINKLKSLRPRPHWKPSEEQMRALNEIICLGEISYVGQEEELIALRNKLKKLM